MEKTNEKIYIVVWESNVDGERLFQVAPCRTLEAAKKQLKQNIYEIFNNGHFMGINKDDCTIESKDTSFFINDETDDYWDDTYITEKELIG